MPTYRNAHTKDKVKQKTYSKFAYEINWIYLNNSFCRTHIIPRDRLFSFFCALFRCGIFLCENILQRSLSNRAKELLIKLVVKIYRLCAFFHLTNFEISHNQNIIDSTNCVHSIECNSTPFEYKRNLLQLGFSESCEK